MLLEECKYVIFDISFEEILHLGKKIKTVKLRHQKSFEKFSYLSSFKFLKDFFLNIFIENFRAFFISCDLRLFTKFTK